MVTSPFANAFAAVFERLDLIDKNIVKLKAEVAAVTGRVDVVEGKVHDLQHTVALLKAGMSAPARVTPLSMSTVSDATRTATWLGDAGSKRAKHDLTMSFYYSDYSENVKVTRPACYYSVTYTDLYVCAREIVTAAYPARVLKRLVIGNLKGAVFMHDATPIREHYALEDRFMEVYVAFPVIVQFEPEAANEGVVTGKEEGVVVEKGFSRKVSGPSAPPKPRLQPSNQPFRWAGAWRFAYEIAFMNMDFFVDQDASIFNLPEDAPWGIWVSLTLGGRISELVNG
eukprot:jgi/Chrpa1/10328/Chrysochromulina_OHIO_Genome00012242-RA